MYISDQEYGSFGVKGILKFTDQFGVTTGFGSAFGSAFFGNNVAKQVALTYGVYLWCLSYVLVANYFSKFPE